MASPSSSHRLTALPIELLVFVIDNLEDVAEIAALARTSRRLYGTANALLYKRAAQRGDARPLAWAARRGLATTLGMALAAGGDPNAELVEHIPAEEWERARDAACAAVAAGREKEVWGEWDFPYDERRLRRREVVESKGMKKGGDKGRWSATEPEQQQRRRQQQQQHEPAVAGPDVYASDDNIHYDSPNHDHPDDAPTPASTSTADPSSSVSSSSSHTSLSDHESIASSPPSDPHTPRSGATPPTEPSSPSSTDSPPATPTAITITPPTITIAATTLPPTSTSPTPTVRRRYTPLHLAARTGDLEVVSLLLQHGADPNVPSERFCACTPLCGLLNHLEQPRDEEAEQAKGAPPWGPLHVAICHRHEDVALELLLAASAGRRGMEVLRLEDQSEAAGCQEGTGTRTRTRLLGFGGAAALHHAAGMGLTRVVRWLVERDGAGCLEEQDEFTLTPFYHAYAHRRWETTVPLLLELGADMDVAIKMYIPYTAITPLGEACRLGDFDVADRLIDLGADVKKGFLATGTGGCLTPLHMCCMRSAVPVGEVRARKSKAGEEGQEGQEAGQEQDEDDDTRGAARMRTIDKLLARGAQLNARDCFGSTPLMAAVQACNTFALEALSLAGADFEGEDAQPPVGGVKH